MKFEFTAPARIIFGPGALQQVGKIAEALGDRALVVTGMAAERVQPLLGLLDGAGVGYVLYLVESEPPPLTWPGMPPSWRSAKAAAFVIGIGGGSAMDTAKAAAAFLADPGDPYDHLEVVAGASRCATFRRRGLPFPPRQAPAARLPAMPYSSPSRTR